jgi:dTDP-4-dehydrorhamnose reductase
MNRAASGVIHLPGADCVSKFEFGVRVAQALGLNSNQVQKTTSESANFIALRPKNTCLNGDKILKLLGVQLPSLDEGIRRMLALRDQGYLETIRIR